MTIKELASLAGVSVSTVSKVMNGKDRNISEQTRDKILNLAKDYHYRPYSSIKNNDSRTMILGVVLRSARSTGIILEGIGCAAQAQHYELMTSFSNNDPRLEYRMLTSLIEHHVDGLLWEMSDQPEPGSLDLYAQQSKPIILFQSNHPDSVNMDYTAAANLAVRFLIEQRHTDIACLSPSGFMHDQVEQGYKQALFDASFLLRSEFLFEAPTSDLFSKIAGHAFTALLCADEQTAVSIYDELTRLHYEIPDDFSLITLTDASKNSSVHPLLTSCGMPGRAFGLQLCQKLISQIEQSSDQPTVSESPVILNKSISVKMPYLARRKKILVVGSIHVDNYLRVDAFPSVGSSITSSSYHRYPGGKGMNMAVGTAKLGQRVSLIGSVGSDLDGDMIFETIQHYKIGFSAVTRQSEKSTGQAYVLVQPDANSLISIVPGANDSLTPEYLRKYESHFRNTAYCLIPTEISIEAVETACLLAKKYDVQTILKPTRDFSLTPTILAHCDYLIPYEQDLNMMYPDLHDLDEKVDWLLSQGVGTVIVTRSEKGCYVKNRQISQYFASSPVQEPLDYTGASDAFISAFASYLLYDYSLADAIRYACTAASFCISREGCTPALIDKNSLDAYMATRNENNS